jgi:hypothetical protein
LQAAIGASAPTTKKPPERGLSPRASSKNEEGEFQERLYVFFHL